MPKKYYVVWQGRQPGIFDDWDACKRQVDQFAGAKYRSFKTRSEAEAAFRRGRDAAPAKPGRTPGRPAGKGPRTWSAAEVDGLDARTKIFTDGGCEPNPGEAASGVAVYRDGMVDELWYGLYQPRGTNNSAELHALHQALLIAEKDVAQKSSVAIFCDSTYSIQCITRWAFNWEKRGWKKPDGEIKNLELIQAVFALYKRLKGSVEVLHVNGHVGVEGNELADRMSIHGIDTRETEFRRFQTTADIAAVLAMRKG
ncbi:MAG: ribonuclease H family protein [Candidatus Krumholzibacteriia bacterium]